MPYADHNAAAVYRAAHRTEAAAATRAWCAANPDRVRAANATGAAERKARLLLRRETLLMAQGGVCAICGTPEPGSAEWHLDHDHACCPCKPRDACGMCDRGVLCNRCNTRLVPAAESPLLPLAVAYVERHASAVIAP